MKTQQETSVLRYDRLSRRVQAVEEGPAQVERPPKLNDAMTWGVLSFCLAGWAVVGLFLWIPRLLRAVLAFSGALINATLTETDATAAGRRLRSAANFYRRGFVSAVESIQPTKAIQDDHGDAGPSKASVRSGLIVRETAWAIVVWYIVAWTAGFLRGTPFDLATVPWSNIAADAMEIVRSIPQLFRR